MQHLFHAGFVFVDEVEFAFVVGFADQEFDTTDYFQLQRALNPVDDPGWGPHSGRGGQHQGAYVWIISCVWSAGRIEFTIDESTATAIGTPPSFAVKFSYDEALLHRLYAGLQRMFRGTDTQLRRTLPAVLD